MKFVAIDFETSNTHRSSPCSLGICVVEDSKIIEEREWLIKPPRNHYNPNNIEVHGITPEMTADQPEFHELWGEIKPYIHRQVLLAHNGNNIEKNVIVKTLKHYGISYLEQNFRMVDTLSLSKSLFLNLKNYRLQDICNLLSIPFDETMHHNSLYDARKTAELGIKLYEHFALLPNFYFDPNYMIQRAKKEVENSVRRFKGEDFEEMIMDKKAKSISSELKQMKTDVEDTSHFFYQKKVVITGTFDNFPIREEMAKLLHNVGADINTHISGRTDYVILGQKAGPKKLEQIEKLDITTIDEQKFLEIFNLL